MRLVRLRIRSFSCIESADIQLGPGLNILYGPNDLGKSSILEALRAALLLPANSSAQKEFVPWGKDVKPEIEIDYSIAPNVFWRVKKTYDEGSGSSSLESSTDGLSFVTTDIKARRVDEEVRKHLAWGIPGPTKTKGVPESFIATILLSKQGEVDALLAQSLSEKYDDGTGRARIGKALQAVAQDPRFRAFLNAATVRVEEAISSIAKDGTPKWRTARTSPIQKLKERVEQLQAEADVQGRAVEETDGVLVELRDRKAALEGKETQRDERKSEVAELERLLVAWSARRLVEAERKKALDELARMDGALAALATLRAERTGLETKARDARAAVEGLHAGEDRARTALEGARKELVERQAGVATVEARKQELAQKLLSHENARMVADARRAKARAAGDVAARITEQEKLVADTRKSLAAIDASNVTLGTAEQALVALERETAGLEQVSALMAARKDLEQAEKDASEVRRLEGEAAKKREESQRLEAAVSAAKLPTPAKLEELQSLERQRIKADAVLEVGLSVELRPERPLEVRASLDGASGGSSSVSAPTTFEARREVRLSVASVGELIVRGGTKEKRDQAEAVRRRWEETTAPIFAAAGVQDLSALARRCAEVAAQTQNARQLAAEAKHAEDLARQRGDVASKRTESTARVARGEESLAGHDRPALEARATAFGAGLHSEIARRKKETPAKLAEARKKLRQGELEREGLVAKVAERETQVARLRQELAASEVELGGPWAVAHDAAAKLVASIEGERAQAQKEVARLTADVEKTLAQAVKSVNAAQEILATATRARTAGEGAAVAAEKALASAQGRLDAEEARAPSAEARAAARGALDAADAALLATPAPPRNVTEADVQTGRTTLEKAGAEVNQAANDLHAVTGKLQQLGGADARERREILLAQLEEAKSGLTRTEEDYHAWRLLRDTLVEVESEQASQLGSIFSPPLSKMFSDLTSGRYGVEMGAELETRGVIVAGGVQSQQRLSVGTREQLATVFRVALAKELKSTLVLDDQLVQSDAERMGWFAKLLRDAAQGIQIVVLTCRAGDYLEAMELPAGGVALKEVGGVRAIDLSRVVQRARVQAG